MNKSYDNNNNKFMVDSNNSINILEENYNNLPQLFKYIVGLTTNNNHDKSADNIVTNNNNNNNNFTNI